MLFPPPGGSREAKRVLVAGVRSGAVRSGTAQHSSGGWKLRLQSTALVLGGWARFLRSSSRPRELLRRRNAVLYFLSNAAADRDGRGLHSRTCWF